MIKTIKQTQYEIMAFDLENTVDPESVKNNETRMWLGCLIGEDDKLGDDVFYYDIVDFVDKLEELTKPIGRSNKHKNLMIYIWNLAHEWSFILPELVRRGLKPGQISPRKGKSGMSYEAVTNKSVSSVWTAGIKFNSNGGIIRFRDLAKLLGGSLKNAAKSLKTETQKGDDEGDLIDYEAPRPKGYIPTELEKEYNYNDCRIIIEILQKINNTEDKYFWKSLSAASWSASTFIGETYKKYKKPMAQYRKDYPQLYDKENDFIRKTIKGGICYATPYHQGENIKTPVFHIDAHQMHPSQMYFKFFPYGHGKYFKGEPPKDRINAVHVLVSYSGVKLHSNINCLNRGTFFADGLELWLWDFEIPTMYKCYEDKGWDVYTGQNNCEEYHYPILSDFLKALNAVVKEKKFSQRLNDDYVGSLVSRFSNLRKGPKGRMLNTEYSVDFSKLVEQNVIIELENLKSAEDKALLMGLFLARLSAVLRQKHKANKDFRHITLIEEAHRLLSKVEYGDSGSKKSAVETFSDLLAEVRKYGEGLIIVDQIPNKLAPEVIKNTNTKIIHKILARDDKETVGDSMMMNDKQKEFLSALETGQAVVFTEGLSKPVHIAIQRVTDTNEAEISDELVRNRFLHYVNMKANNQLKELYIKDEVIERFYEKYNQELMKFANQYRNKSLSYSANEFMNEINSFCKNQDKNMKSKCESESVLDILAKEKSNHSSLNGYKERLCVFSKKYFIYKDLKGGLKDEQLANLVRFL